MKRKWAGGGQVLGGVGSQHIREGICRQGWTVRSLISVPEMASCRAPSAVSGGGGGGD